MKLSLALALVTVGTTSSLGNAFASPNISFVSKAAAQTNTALSFQASTAVRGGDSDSSSCLSSTKEEVSMGETVSTYVSQGNWDLLSQRGQTALTNLINGDEGIGAQTHVYADWPEKGTNDEGKVKVTEQVSFIFIFNCIGYLHLK